MSDGSAILKIKRSNEYINRWRHYQIYVDGKKEGVIANGGQLDIKVSPGTHQLYAQIDWGYSQKIELDLQAGEVRSVSVGGFKGATWIMPVSLTIAIGSQLAMIFFGRNSFYILILALPGFFVLMYYLTIGRKRYLNLTQE